MTFEAGPGKGARPVQSNPETTGDDLTSPVVSGVFKKTQTNEGVNHE
jgi:hypothetical protein